MISLAHIQVVVCEAFTLQRLTSDAQKGIAAEMLQLIHGIVSEMQKMHDLAIPSMPGWRLSAYVAAVEIQKGVSSIWNLGLSAERLGVSQGFMIRR